MFVISCDNLETYTDIYGIWQGEHKNKQLTFVFDRDKTCILTINDKQSKIVEKIDGNYQINFRKNPIPLSIHSIPQLNHPLHTIIEFIRDDSIRIAEFSPKLKLRPISFVTGNELHFKRIIKKGIKNDTIIQ